MEYGDLVKKNLQLSMINDFLMIMNHIAAQKNMAKILSMTPGFEMIAEIKERK